MEILHEKVRREIHSCESILNLNRDVIFEMNQEYMVDARPGRNMEKTSDVRRCATRLQRENGRSVLVSAQANFVSNISYFKGMRRCLQIRYKRTDPGDSLHVALIIQLAQRPIGRHP